MVNVKLISTNFLVNNEYDCVILPDQEQMLSFIASQSRRHVPAYRAGLFKDTVNFEHESIQEFAWYVFHIQDTSRIVLAQNTRHRIASYNCQSGRHVEVTDIVIPPSISSNEVALSLYLDTFDAIKKDMQQLISLGVPLEDARYIMPTGGMISFFFGINGRAVRNFLKLRLSPKAQWEIRSIAAQIYLILNTLNPDLLIDVYPKQVKLSSMEVNALSCGSICDTVTAKLDKYKTDVVEFATLLEAHKGDTMAVT